MLAPSPAPGLAPSPAAVPSPGPPPLAPPAAEEDTVPEGEVRIRAETQKAQGGHYHFDGLVDLRFGDTAIQADRLDFYQEPKEGGGESRRVHAEGNVVLIRGEERLAGRSLDLDLDRGTGFFADAVGYLNPGVFVEGSSIERVDKDTYRIRDALFSSCAQPKPRWSFSASSATVEVGDKIKAKNVFFRVKSVPAFYLPYLVYPIKDSQRATGFLFPHFGYTSQRGFNVGAGFFWAMGRSADQTFFLDHYSKFGLGLGHELRWVGTSPSRGTFSSQIFRLQGGDDYDYDLNWTALQNLPGKVRANARVRLYSNTLFQQRIQESLDLASRRERSASGTVDRTFLFGNLQVLGDSRQTFFGDDYRVNRHLPTLRLFRTSQRQRSTGLVYGYEIRGERLALGDQVHVDTYNRFDVQPRVSRPWSLPYLQITPSVSYRYTQWGTRLDEETGALTGPALTRQYGEGSVEFRGPTFSRVFETPGNFYSDKYKHVIGPEVTWTYRSRVEDFAVAPKFDGADYVLGTHQVSYGRVSRLWSRRATRPGQKPAPWEFLTWNLNQTYYVKVNNDPAAFDPNYSSSAFGPGGLPDHNSPILSRVRVRPVPGTSADFNLEYDINFKQLRSLGLTATLDRSRLMLQGAWSKAINVAGREENRIPIRNTVRGSTRIDVLPGRLKLEGSLDYDAIQKTFVQSTGRLRWNVQCCGFTAELIKSDFNIVQDTQFRFSIELANIGSVGSFNGQDAAMSRSGFGGLP